MFNFKSYFKMTSLLLALFAALPAKAYITSATLEYSCDDQAAFHLNGSVMLERSDFAPFDFNVLSTSDGTLPLELFKENEDNLLAVENFDTEGGSMTMAYRLTVYHSDGDPVVVYSNPDDAKFLHLNRRQRNPAGWTQVNFNDSAWGKPLAIRLKTQYTASADLFDSRLEGLFNTGGFVPFLVHKVSAAANGGDHNLYRSHFRFPNNPSKVEIKAVPETAKFGEQIAVRLYPGPDTTEYSNFNIMAWVPKDKLKIFQTSPGSRYDKKLGRLHWGQSSRDLQVGYVKLGVEKIVSASGWVAPKKVLGMQKKGKVRRQLNVPDVVFNDGAVMTIGREGWFKIQAPRLDLRKGVPKIQGIIFHSQMRVGGINNKLRTEVDKVFFNYSVDGRRKGVLEKRGFNVARTSASNYWIDGYYDASEDRDWQWKDLSNLMVMFKAQQRGTRDKNLLASVVATVRYYYPGKVSPWFRAQVLTRQCAKVPITTGLFRHGTKSMSTDKVELVLGDCRPTPVPTRTFTPVPLRIVKPAPTSTPVPARFTPVVPVIKLSNIMANPDPFDYGGTFISFKIKRAATIEITVYDQSGKGMRRIAGKEFRAGNQQIFFNTLGDNKKRLKPGLYIYDVKASAPGTSEVKQGKFRVVRKKRKR